MRVLSNGGRNRTLHAGIVREAIWHHEHACWNYYLQVGGRRISKRYGLEDLERTGDDGRAPDGAPPNI